MTDIDDNYLRIGVVTGTHAIRGWLKVYIITDNIVRFLNGSTVFLKKEKSYIKFKISDFNKYKKKACLLKLEGIDDLSTAETYHHYEIFIKKADAENNREDLKEGEFYYYDLIGCSVFFNGNIFGSVADLFNAGAGDILVIRDKSGKQHMVPFVEKMVDTERIGEKRIDIYPIEGLIDI